MNQPTRNNPEHVLPEDLCAWFDLAQLGKWTEEQIESLDWDNAELAALIQRNPAFRPKCMLRVLTLAHAEGLSDMQTIAERCLEHEIYREACDGWACQADELLAFREQNCELLESMLLELMKRAVKERFDCGILPTPVKKYLRSLAAGRVHAVNLADRQPVAA